MEAPGETEPALRAVLAAGPGRDPDPLASYLAKVRANAWRITDDEVAALSAAGLVGRRAVRADARRDEG